MRIPAVFSALLALALPTSVANASGDGAAGGESLHLVPMDRISVPITDGGRLDGNLRVALVLDAADEESAAQLKETMPELRAAALAASLEFARLHASGMRAVDVSLLDHDLTGALQAANHGVARVLIVEVAASRN
ncbi:hypothetical protein [Stakelama tenebrarum]|uniref:Uncharacterized protein n=1 Tax=Stakelama tenebrarum TaxID=2711215 RepID=A0A6G6Y4A1_9SPHN|nr:hypothetical protein [Sphingosinithalassobacter tenebrarum]QIG79671.1 hypothetical protein G5C33_07615 [Sphingosinithalassobacter tenebrarum]